MDDGDAIYDMAVPEHGSIDIIRHKQHHQRCCNHVSYAATKSHYPWSFLKSAKLQKLFNFRQFGIIHLRKVRKCMVRQRLDDGDRKHSGSGIENDTIQIE